MNSPIKYLLPRKMRASLRRILIRIRNLSLYINALVFKKQQKKHFLFNDIQFNYFISLYNTTFQNERAIEIPIILDYIKKVNGKNVLEIGNVMKHYFKNDHIVVDKYEKGNGVLNLDIIDYEPNDRFDIIVSISTFEHIGFDEVLRYSDEKKNEVFQESLLKAIEKTKSLLNDNGLFVFTAPYGFNSFLDAQLEKNQLKMTELYYLKRVSKDNAWEQVSLDDLKGTLYGNPYTCANGMIIGIFKNT